MKILFILLAALGLSSGACGYENLSAEDFSDLIEKGGVLILDVRTPEEFAQGHIDGAILVDFRNPSFKENALKVLKKDVPVAIYCRSGRRSAAAAEILAKEGYRLYNLETGVIGWSKAGKQLVK